MIVDACATALADGRVSAPSARAAAMAPGAMSKALATTLANFKRDKSALPIAPVPTKPIFSIFGSSVDSYVTACRFRIIHRGDAEDAEERFYF
jgi:hypothetical protein